MAIHSITITPEMAGHTIPHSFTIAGPDLENLETHQSECVKIAKAVFASVDHYNALIERRSKCLRKDFLELDAYEDDLHEDIRQKLVNSLSTTEMITVSIYIERAAQTDKIKEQIKKIEEAIKAVSMFSKKTGISFSQLLDLNLNFHKRSEIFIKKESVEAFYFPRI